MVNSLQITQLINALKWLTWLITLSLALLLIGFSCLNSSSEISYPIEPQFIDYPIYRYRSVAILTPTLKKGKLLFDTNCQACHELSDATVVGPGLLGVTERVPNRAWLVKWIKNPSAVLKSGDVYANHMAKMHTAKYSGPILMPGFPSLKEKEVQALIDYIDSYKIEGADFVQ